MVQSVELILDAAADAAVRRQWELLAKAGLPSQADVRSESNRPHITMAVAEVISLRTEDRLSKLEFVPFPIRLGGLTVFGGSRAVLVRLVMPSPPLLDIHRRVSDVVAGAAQLAEHTRPGQWTPHTTLARRIEREQLGEALATVIDEPDIVGEAVAVRRWDGSARREWQIA